MGADSFTPDSGVMLAKTKNADAAPFTWVIDSNPQDIGMTDYVLPDGTKVPITIGDYRQLSDALLHAGTNSGSEFEFVDTANRLHFYVLDLQRDSRGVLSYTVAVRSLDGAGPQQRGVRVNPTAARRRHRRRGDVPLPVDQHRPHGTSRWTAPGARRPVPQR